jgi:RNA polymerase sigma-70 factor (ECF subfamily)
LYLRAVELVRGEFEVRTWQAFWLSTVEDRDPGVVGQELNMTPNNVRQARSRVLRRLREELGDLLE